MEVEGTPLEAPFTQEEIDLLSCKVTALNLNFYPLDKFSPLPLSFARYFMFLIQMINTSKHIYTRHYIFIQVS
jgi:hypothetical protein